MKRPSVLLVQVILIPMLAACSSGGGTDRVEETATQFMAADGFADAQITDIVEGDPATVPGADELYCVRTDATSPGTELPYLVLVWRGGETWKASQLEEGDYDWQLHGCD